MNPTVARVRERRRGTRPHSSARHFRKGLRARALRDECSGHSLGGLLLLARLAWQPTGLRINMMPIVIGDVTTLPRECWPYVPLLPMCPVSRGEWGPLPPPAALPHTNTPQPATAAARCAVPRASRAVCVREAVRVAGEVGYFTIDESVVAEGASQRRAGLHTESPGGLRTAGIAGGAAAQQASEMRKLPRALHTPEECEFRGTKNADRRRYGTR